MITNNKDSDLPKDLAGWQAIAPDEVIRDGDIWVSGGAAMSWCSASIDSTTNEWFGHVKVRPMSVYRKIPVAKQGDSDPSWREASDKLHDQMGEVGIDSIAGQAKASTHDEGKPPLADLPWKALRQVAQVMAYGGRKYDKDNWRKGLEVRRNCSCAIRHIADYLDGQNNDPESFANPLAHAVCRLLFILETTESGTSIDDRYRPAEPIPDHNGSGLGKEPSPGTKTP